MMTSDETLDRLRSAARALGMEEELEQLLIRSRLAWCCVGCGQTNMSTLSKCSECDRQIETAVDRRAKAAQDSRAPGTGVQPQRRTSVDAARLQATAHPFGDEPRPLCGIIFMENGCEVDCKMHANHFGDHSSFAR